MQIYCCSREFLKPYFHILYLGNNQGSDKENDHEETNAVKKEIPKTYSKTNAVQKVLSTKNGTLQMSTTSSTNDRYILI